MAMLRPSQTSFKVTLVDKTKHFEVYANDADEQEYEFLQEVRSQIVSAVREVLEKMQIKLNVAEGFECTCGQGKQHKQQKALPYFSCVHGCKTLPKRFWVKNTGKFFNIIYTPQLS